MDINWIIFANSSIVYIYSITYKPRVSSFQFITKLEHPASRKKRQELISDRPGHYQTKNPARGAYSEHTDPKEVEADKFAKELASLLEKNRIEKQYKHLILVLAPHFYGLLRKHFSKPLLKTIKKAFIKDIVVRNEHELKKYVDVHLHL